MRDVTETDLIFWVVAIGFHAALGLTLLAVVVSLPILLPLAGLGWLVARVDHCN